MKTEEINGKLYEVVPEVEEGSCEGCTFSDSFCIGTGECTNGHIYKEIEDNPKENKSKLKEFNLEAAKDGKPVCTRDERKARIICFDAKSPKTSNIIALVEKEDGEEEILYYYNNGSCSIGKKYDLMMLPEKKEGWINVYKGDNKRVAIVSNAYATKEKALSKIDEVLGVTYITTKKIEWEE